MKPQVQSVDALDHLPDDIVIIIRGGEVMLVVPEHEPSEPVPDDFIVALGFAHAFGDPKMRRILTAIADTEAREGNLDEIMSIRPRMQ